MPKITFIGAGSVVFTRNLLRDVLSFPELAGSEVSLMDVDAQRLARISALADKMIGQERASLRESATTDRREALSGADYVVITIQVGGEDQWLADIEIPEKYGVSQCVGDTLGPGGIFRGLRHLAAFDGILTDIAAVCPQALVLQYSNPMSILTWRVGLAGLRVVGLCHSIQGTASMIADMCGVPPGEISYSAAGINHQAWFLSLEHKRKDLYPALRALLDDPNAVASEPVRFELLRRFGYFVSESSGHASEYVPYFRKRPDLLERLVASFAAPSTHSDWFGYGRTGGCVRSRIESGSASYDASVAKQLSGEEPIPMQRSDEYGARIIAASESGVPIRINGNVANTGLITNLPQGACVEVPCLVDASGVKPCVVGDLPPQLAALNRAAIGLQELTVQGHLTRDRELIRQAIALDPLTAAVCSLDEIWELADAMFASNEAWLPDFRERRP